MPRTVYAYKAQNIWSFLLYTAPSAQGMLKIRYCMRRVCLQFATACLEYAYKANYTQILPFQLNQVKTYEKSKNQKSYFWHFQVDLKAIRK